jgi:hypothetical protein
MSTERAIPQEVVREFVGSAHGNLARVAELLDEWPGLANAAWDWKGGDWETALGAAAQTGNREIALLLLSRGARVDLFAAAMLGELEVVRAIVAAHPQMRHALGSHGIPLVDFARAGGEPARAVVAFLESEQG